MKILQVIPFFSPEFGGSVTSTFLTCQKLSERGHTVTILTTDFHFDSSYAQKLKNVEVIPIECLCHIGLFFYSPKMKAWLSENLSKYDIIHLQNFRSYQNAIVSLYAKKHEIPYILQARGTFPRLDKKSIKILFDIVYGANIIKGASQIIMSSQIESDQFRKTFPTISFNNVLQIPNGLDLCDYQDHPGKGQFKKKYCIAKDDKVVLFLSRIHMRKGPDLLLSAFAQLLERNENIKLVIAGHDVGYNDKLMKMAETLQISDNVFFPGPLYGKEKLEAYIDADVFVLPSKDRYESFGNVVIEALACGTPIIITNNCGVSEYIGHDCGFVIDYDIKQLYLALHEILNNETTHNKMSEDAKKLVYRLDMNMIIPQYEKVYEISKKR